ncbi:MAG TPA: MCP four helix bundle domain-containing protein, partial [Kineosporiaceae bacterium]|nr:MCP four helix bundle domain-containing protein [Kineosporiaceae bacterium]
MTTVSAFIPAQSSRAVSLSPKRFFADLKISAKIITLVALAGVLTAVVGLVGQRALVDLRDTNKDIANVSSHKTILALDAKSDWIDLRRLILRSLLAPSSADAVDQAQKADAQFTAVRADFDALTKMGLDPRDTKTLDEQVLPNIAATEVLWTDKIKPLAMNPNRTAAQTHAAAVLVADKFGPLANSVADGAEKISTANQADTQAEVKDATKSASRA